MRPDCGPGWSEFRATCVTCRKEGFTERHTAQLCQRGEIGDALDENQWPKQWLSSNSRHRKMKEKQHFFLKMGT